MIPATLFSGLMTSDVSVVNCNDALQIGLEMTKELDSIQHKKCKPLGWLFH